MLDEVPEHKIDQIHLPHTLTEEHIGNASKANTSYFTHKCSLYMKPVFVSLSQFCGAHESTVRRGDGDTGNTFSFHSASFCSRNEKGPIATNLGTLTHLKREEEGLVLMGDKEETPNHREGENSLQERQRGYSKPENKSE